MFWLNIIRKLRTLSGGCFVVWKSITVLTPNTLNYYYNVGQMSEKPNSGFRPGAIVTENQKTLSVGYFVVRKFTTALNLNSLDFSRNPEEPLNEKQKSGLVPVATLLFQSEDAFGWLFLQMKDQYYT